MKTTTHPASSNAHIGPVRPTRGGERGYALLGLLLALSVIAIFLVSSVVPNVKMDVQRTKEAEMIYRGNQLAKAIARYYAGYANPGNGTPRLFPYPPPLKPPLRPPYGPLLELKKLRDGVTLAVQEVKFARATELIDPMTGIEWEPVRLRDPRIEPFLQAYAIENNWIITPDYHDIAGPRAKIHKIKPDDSESSSTSQSSENQSGQPGGVATVRPPPKPKPDDSDDDDDDDVDDPLGHFFESSSGSSFDNSTLPIVGVAPKLKGKATRPLYGLEYYQEWVFIYIPPNQNTGPVTPNQPNQSGGKLNISP
jgi:type II secretory pathway pseudopilin PulG